MRGQKIHVPVSVTRHTIQPIHRAGRIGSGKACMRQSPDYRGTPFAVLGAVSVIGVGSFPEDIAACVVVDFVADLQRLQAGAKLLAHGSSFRHCIGNRALSKIHAPDCGPAALFEKAAELLQGFPRDYRIVRFCDGDSFRDIASVVGNNAAHPQHTMVAELPDKLHIAVVGGT